MGGQPSNEEMDNSGIDDDIAEASNESDTSTRKWMKMIAMMKVPMVRYQWLHARTARFD